jgi:hypothetical protein
VVYGLDYNYLKNISLVVSYGHIDESVNSITELEERCFEKLNPIGK